MRDSKMKSTKGTRSRAVSLSCDWNTIISEEQRSSLGKVSMFREMDELVEHDEEEKLHKPTIEFCTESSYTGQWDSLGMSGFGTYTFPHGVEYEGHFEDGMFHGEGTLIYPMGQRIEGTWVNGIMVSHVFRFADGLEYNDMWNYCQMPDRRFYISIFEGLRPANREYLTNEQPTRIIPKGCYDTGRGFFDPKTKCITGALSTYALYQKIKEANTPKMVKVVGDVYERPQVQIATDKEEEWIVQHCRKAWDETTGYRPDLYERWVSGRYSEIPDEEVMDESSDVDDFGQGSSSDSLFYLRHSQSDEDII